MVTSLQVYDETPIGSMVRPSLQGDARLKEMIAMTTLDETSVPTKERSVEKKVEQSVQQQFDACPYAFIFRNVSAHFEDGLLTLIGRLPTFYLKQCLQELLRNTENVKQISNEVDVVNFSRVNDCQPPKP